MSRYYGLLKKIVPERSLARTLSPYINSRILQNCMFLSTNANEATPTTSADENTEKPKEIDKNQKVLSVEEANELKSSLEKMKLEAADFKDKYVRSLAESENVRRRNKKMLEDSKLYSIQSFCKELLEVADILEKATESVPKEEIEKNDYLKSLYEGLTMTEVQLQKVFKNHGLEKVNPLNEKFDPHFHEALFQLPGENSGTVAVVQKTGYRLHGRPLRAALVGVVK